MKKLIASGMAAALTALVFSSIALGAPHHPKGEFTQFADCPLNRVTVTDCLRDVITGGSFSIGKKTVPIVNPITFQGGAEGSGSEVHFFGAEDGNTFSKTPQPVPGGLFGITAPAWWPKSVQEKFNNSIDNGFSGTKSIIELAGPATSIKLNTENMINQEGVALALPVKIKLENRLLGNNCYIGSNSNPIQIEFTVGTTSPPPPNQPIQGTFGELLFNEEFTLITINGTRLVNNSLAVPKASGCGGLLSAFVDPLVNSLLGLPSASGRNTLITEGMLQLGAAWAVRASEN